MARFLQTLLSATEPMFSVGMAQLEKTTGHSGVDTRLIADITGRAHDVMRRLGLDTRDSTGQEVFLALIASVRRGSAESVLVDSDYVLLLIDGQVVSFNLIDVIESSHFGLSFESQSLSHGQRSLRGELVKRYSEHLRTDETVTREIASGMGLLPESDSWYNETNVQQIQTHNKETKMKPYILAIGDVFTDAFIQLREDEAKIITEQDGSEWLAMPFGRKPPYERADIIKSVGPGPNVAVAAARLGQSAGVMAWVGDDLTGTEAIEHLQSEKVDTSSMVTEKGKLTSYWYVLRYGADRTMLVKSEKYKYEWRDPEVEPDWIYLTYLGEDSWPLHEALLQYLDSRPHIKLAFQPGAFQFRWGVEKMAPIYRRSNMVLLNREEAMDVTGLPYDSVTNLANGLHELGPDMVVITDGSKGSYVSSDGKVLTMPNYPDDAPPVDRTGAGDAFSATFLVAIATGESVETALRWAPINPVGVIQDVGAQRGLMNREKLQEYLDKAPDWYQPKEFEG